MSRVVHAIFEPAHVFWGTCCIYDQRKPRQACGDSRLAFVTNIHKVWMKIKARNKIWTSSPTRCVESHNDTLVGGMPPLKIQTCSIFQSNPWPVDLTCCMLGYFYAFYHLLILPDLGPNCLLRLSAGGTCIKSVVRRSYQLAPRAVQNNFHGIDQFALVRHGGDKSRAL